MWVKLDDHFPDHWKLAELGDYAPLCGWLHICGLAFCNRQLTDGRIPAGQVARLASFRHISVAYAEAVGAQFAADVDADHLAELLVKVGLWEKSEGGYQIHDYLEYQYSKDEVLEIREKRRQAGVKGGRATAARKQSAKQLAEQSANQVAQQKLKQNLAPVPGTRSAPIGAEKEAPLPATDQWFNRLWVVYPNKERKELAFKEYAVLISAAEHAEALAEKILQDVTTRVKYGWAKRERHMIPQLANYLHEHQYDDGIEVGPVVPPVEALYDCRVCHQTHLGPDSRICTKELGPVYRCTACGNFHQGFNKAICAGRKQEVA